MRIRGDHPFFGTLGLFAEFRLTDAIQTAATDGRVLWFNPSFVDRQNLYQLCGLVAHELLHVALQHVSRRQVRDVRMWNIAADIVVNGMIRNGTSYELPIGGVEVPKLAHLSVEEIYEQFAAGKAKAPKITLLDLVPDVSGAVAGTQGNQLGRDDGCMGQEETEQLERYWRAALQQACAVALRNDRGFGKHGLDGIREIDSATRARMNWREILWQFMVLTPYDFGGFDRRFIHRKLYLDDVIGESMEVTICVDTSGSISSTELGAFTAEVRSILDAYPQINVILFFADIELYGPHEFSLSSRLPDAKGGGGTSFIPFFDWVNQQERNGTHSLCIYFTDGHGTFPRTPPASQVLWVVTSGGLETTRFPFGEVTRMQGVC